MSGDKTWMFVADVWGSVWIFLLMSGCGRHPRSVSQGCGWLQGVIIGDSGGTKEVFGFLSSSPWEVCAITHWGRGISGGHEGNWKSSQLWKGLSSQKGNSTAECFASSPVCWFFCPPSYLVLRVSNLCIQPDTCVFWSFAFLLALCFPTSL